MFLEKIKSEGLSHLSYLIGDQGKAAVIDPRRDCEIYMETAYRNGCRITHVFETHRNEDYAIGSRELAELTGAEIYHGANLPFKYGRAAREGDVFNLGNIGLKILETPGHTMESISVILYDTKSGEDPLGIFTGDALFIGDVGRTDFFPDKKEKMAGLLYDSIFKKILPLGDQVIIYPAHGAGSICGSQMSDREFSTIGYERLNNTLLQIKDKNEFIKTKVNEEHALPPYFSRMEEYNLSGPPVLGQIHLPRPVNAHEFEKMYNQGMQILDIRSAQSFAGVYIPGSISIPLNMVPLYAGWFLTYNADIGIVSDSTDDLKKAVTYLARIGFDRVSGFLHKALHQWEIQGKYFESIPAVYAGEIQRRISNNEEFTLLDVRTRSEFSKEHLPGAKHIFLGELGKRAQELNTEESLTTFCGSGQRAIIAASILKRLGFKKVENCFGSIQACSKGVCEIISDQD
ncbi:MAG: MBL fold metallo-hydrolase [Desulfonatronovibrio sp. MSAO_Bac4]|nr:MAG: MBL fold metallo-hydrolase [Desulfonatronovibrio sp. MSAO_Bac4]